MVSQTAYLDHASTSPTRKSSVDAMLPFFSKNFGNASSPYLQGRESRKAIDNSKDKIASLMECDSREIIFTSGGTEAIIIALVGAALGNRHRGNHLITSAFEHHAVHAVFDFLRDEMGFETEFFGVDENGIIRLDELERKVSNDTVLISAMAVNNEIGTIQPINEIVELCAGKNILVHSDFVQAIGKIPLSLGKIGVDIANVSGHKFGGPKGIGFLYMKSGTYLKPICSSSHEFGIRAGTENVGGIAGIASGLEEAIRETPELENRLTGFRKRILDCIFSVAPDAKINGNPDKSVVSIINLRM
ncbi:MAG TPA: cysteine desulfurase, partial [Firmicutes bacterium]|nr:cysteine desulfurase [Bacillota bacterium]